MISHRRGIADFAIDRAKHVEATYYAHRFHLLAALLFMLALATPLDLPASDRSLRDLLRGLATTHGFVIEDLGLISNETTDPVSGDIRDQLKQLLGDYNYIVIENDQGGIEKIAILARGEAVDPPTVEMAAVDIVTSPGQHIVPTRRKGMHQVVDGMLIGPDLMPHSASMVIDTGASTIVLPSSMIKTLGFAAEKLRAGWAQTANGRVRVKTGILNFVEIGSATVEDVAVIFIEDNRLNGTMLLGMSFLGRFQMTIDDANNRIILTSD